MTICLIGRRIYAPSNILRVFLSAFTYPKLCEMCVSKTVKIIKKKMFVDMFCVFRLLSWGGFEAVDTALL